MTSANASGLSHALSLSRYLVNNCPVNFEAPKRKQKAVIFFFFPTTRNSSLSICVIFDKLEVQKMQSHSGISNFPFELQPCLVREIKNCILS